MITGKAMDIDNGIEGAVKTNQPKAKKEKLDDSEFRKIYVPSHRYTPLKDNWMKIFTPVVEHLQLQIRFNLKTRHVEIKAGKETQDISNVQKAADFVKGMYALVWIRMCLQFHLKGYIISIEKNMIISMHHLKYCFIPRSLAKTNGQVVQMSTLLKSYLV